MFLARFQWYRRRRGGKWERVPPQAARKISKAFSSGTFRRSLVSGFTRSAASQKL